MEKYKIDNIQTKLQLKSIINSKKSSKKDYLLINDACFMISNFFDNGEAHKLYIALNSLSSFLENQKLEDLPQLFLELDIPNILFSIAFNHNEQFSIDQITISISSLKYVFYSEQMCAHYLQNDIIENFCSMINDWDNIFSFDKDDCDNEIICIGDLIQIIDSFINYDNSLLKEINEISPIQFLLNMHHSLPFNDPYVTTCFSSYFCSFFNYADSDFLREYIDETISFFDFCSMCYQKKIETTYRYSLWSLSELISKLKQDFQYDIFLQFKLNEFVNTIILKDKDKLVYHAIRVLFYLFSPFNDVDKVENVQDGNEENFFSIDKKSFDIESLIIIPQHREELSDSTKIYSIIAFKKVLEYENEYLVLFYKYEMVEFFINNFDNMSFDFKKAICSLFLYIIEIIADQFLFDIVEQGLFTMFINFLPTESLTLEILEGIKFILDRLQNHENYPILLVFLQEELFQDFLEEIISNENPKYSEIATILKSMTAIEEDEE